MFSDKSVLNMAASVEAGEPLAGPADIQILPTPRCNAACGFCPLHAIPGRLMRHAPRFNTYKSDLPGGLLDRLVDDLYFLGGLERVTFTGGEPLLYSHVVPMIFVFRQAFPEAETTLVTNGIRLRRFAHFLCMAGVSNVSVSVNAGCEETYRRQNPGAGAGVFEEVIAGVAELAEARAKSGADKPRIGLTAVLTSHSAADAEKLRELGQKIGADSITFIPLMEIRMEGERVNSGLAAGPDLYARFREELARCAERSAREGFFMGYADADEDRGVITSGDLYSRQPCYSGYAFAAIYPNGDVRPCCHCEPVMGNLTRQSFIDIWRSERYREARRRMLEIAERGYPKGCLCGECGYAHENREFHRLLGKGPK